MSNRLFISFEFNRPDRTYDRVVRTIKSLGEPWVEIHFAHWYLTTALTAAQACERLKSALDPSDELIVIDVTNRQVAWFNLSKDATGRLTEDGYARESSK